MEGVWCGCGVVDLFYFLVERALRISNNVKTFGGDGPPLLVHLD